ncbi:trypsin-like peptidase domain-containing protein [Streptomyces griseoaurantiacus]|uniref:trypsin-like peptidase domain-containing protein n=1 Tax=Streptomyces griseoaurantiacus TaxID=68213 RepID=UPI002E3324FA|nr:tetratricopeptide repeat protein [Streptomyces jietaisiensis]
MTIDRQRLDEGVVEVAARLPGVRRLSIGSGRLLPDGHVLTAAHLVPEPGPGEVHVRSTAGGDGTWLACRVVYRRHVPPGQAGPGQQAVDLAVLHCAAPPLTRLPGLPPHRWGQLVTGNCRAPVSATGFPRGAAVSRFEDIPAFRDTAQIEGTAGPPSSRTRLRAVRVHGPVPAPLVLADGDATASRWKGMSGSGVFCNGLLVGVVARAAPEPEAGLLFVQDLAPLWEDPALRERLRLPTEGPHAAELRPLLHPHTGHATYSPISLLRPETGAVRFYGRREELARLCEWRDGARDAAARLITGPGGQGKTRLAMEAVGEARRAGWAAGFLSDRADPRELGEILAARTLPVLLVLDYAEARTSQLRALCDVLSSGRGQPPARVLLLARKAGEWWTATEQYARDRGLLEEGDDVLVLPALERAPEARARAARRTAHDLGTRLSALRPGADPVRAPLPDVSDERFAGALNLHMTVLAALLQHLDPVPATGGEPDEVILLLHEHRHWRRTSAPHGLGALSRKELSLLVASATLCGAQDEQEAVATLRRLSRGGGTAVVDDTTAARWLAGLYPTEGRYWGALQPDRLGEFLVGSVLSEERRLLDWLLPAADRRQVETALRLLSRAAPHQPTVPERLRTVVAGHPRSLALPAVRTATEVAEPGPLREALEAVLEQLGQGPGAAEAAFARELYEEVPLPTHALGRWVADLAGLLVRTARNALADGGADATAELAGRLHRYALRLGEIGRAPQGLLFSREAVALRRASVADGGAKAEAELAYALNTRTALLSDCGRTREALASAQETIRLLRRLNERDPDRHGADLAMAETNLANQLHDTGARLAAVEPARNAVHRYAVLAKADPAYTSDLALARHNLSRTLSSAGPCVEALREATAAVADYRILVREAPDSHLADFAGALESLAALLSEAGRHREAKAPAEEAVTLYRSLVGNSPERHVPDLAAALSNAAETYRNCGDSARAVAAAEESVALLRPLTEAQPLSHRLSLGAALVGLGAQNADEDEPERAVRALREAVRLFREGFRSLPDAYGPPLADALCNLGNYLNDAGRDAAAVRACEESVALLRQLVKTEPETHSPRLAIALDVLANTFSDIGADEQALPCYREAYELLVPLARAHPAVHLEELARVGDNWALALSCSERWHDLLDLTERTVPLLRTASEDTIPHRKSLARALGIQGIALLRLDRPHEAVGRFEAAASLSRKIAEAEPDHLPVLLRDLSRLARALSNVGRRREVAVVTAEVLAAHDSRGAADLPPHSRAEALVAHAEALVEAGDHEALVIAEQAVAACRGRGPDAPEDGALLCEALSWYASALSREGLRSQAVGTCEEVLRRSEELYGENSPAELAAPILSLAWARLEDGSGGDAVALAEKALRLLSESGEQPGHEAADEQPREPTGPPGGAEFDDVAAIESATAWQVLADGHLASGRTEQALASARYAVAAVRRLAEQAPEVHLPALAQALGRHALALCAADRRREATAAADEAVTLLRGRFAAEPSAHAHDLASALMVQGRVRADTAALDEAVRIATRFGWHHLAVAADRWRAEQTQ